MPVIAEKPKQISEKTDPVGLEKQEIIADQSPDQDVQNDEIERLYQEVLETNLHKIAQDEKDKSKPKGFKEKLNQISKVLFSRESTYRGLIDILAEELPSLLVESLRGWDSAIEHLFKYIITTSVIMGAPLVAKLISKNAASKILKNIDPKKYGLAMLFNRKDLENETNFDEAKKRIIKEEILDQTNMIRLWGKDSKKSQKHLKKAAEIKDFIKDIKGSDSIRKEATKLKDTVVKKQTLVVSIISAAIPYTVRLFRKYVLGVDRFVGSEKYLSDKDAKRLGSHGFTLRQALGTIACMITSPILAHSLVNKFHTQKEEEQGELTKIMSRHLDTKHSFHPKVGMYALSTSLPYFISRIFNAQDKYEFLETLIKTSFSGGSLWFGDRVTNGRIAKKADAELTEKYGTEPGILYHPPQSKKGFWNWLSGLFPEARKFPEIVEKTKHNPELEKEATEKYQNSFISGFAQHTIGIVILKYAINALTKLRVKRDLKKLNS